MNVTKESLRKVRSKFFEKYGRGPLSDDLEFAQMLVKAHSPFRTADGVTVKVGDKVWVNGSFGTKDTVVIKPVTDYLMHCAQIPVHHSYSTKKAAESAKR